jgi:hypothetical protein
MKIKQYTHPRNLGRVFTQVYFGTLFSSLDIAYLVKSVAGGVQSINFLFIAPFLVAGCYVLVVAFFRLRSILKRAVSPLAGRLLEVMLFLLACCSAAWVIYVSIQSLHAIAEAPGWLAVILALDAVGGLYLFHLLVWNDSDRELLGFEVPAAQ